MRSLPPGYRKSLRYLLSLLLLEFCLIGCASDSSGSASPFAQLRAEATLAQTLPTTAQVKIADQLIQLEVAQTPEQQALGLMYRDRLPQDRGMLFSFSPPRQVGFWMKNVVIPLDMVFLRSGRVESIAANVPPCAAEPCPTYGAKTRIDQVIELRGGRAAELGLKVGDRLVVQPL